MGISGTSSLLVSLVPVPFREVGIFRGGGWVYPRGGFVQEGWVCPGGYPPPRHGTWDTMDYGRQAGGTHPTGILYGLHMCWKCLDSVGYLAVCTVNYLVHSIFRYIEDSLIISERSAINFRFWIRQWELARTGVQHPLPVCGLSMKGKNRSKHLSWSPMKRKTENVRTCGTFTVFSKSI